MSATDLLLQPYPLTPQLTLKNKIIMAPMTRNKANNDFTATDDMALYYARRADAGLIITEGALICEEAQGYTNTPGIYTPAHIQSWRKVTDAVHDKGGHIFLQLWHVGRVSHPHFLKGNLPISASQTMMTSAVRRIAGLFHGQSREATVDEIKNLVKTYAQAASNAIEAGFDGVEIHGANGYLIDQFLHYHTNLRQDNYGGTPPNRARFALEVVKACGAAIGYHRIGLRLSPGGYLNEIMGDQRDAEVFQYLLTQLNEIPIAYVHTGNFDDSVLFAELGHKTMTEFIRAHYTKTLIACGMYTLDKARAGIINQQFDLIAIGRAFIANPDLVAHSKIKEDIVDYHVHMLETLN